ncbi:MAG: dienelactone hydrolase family protein [Spirochaetota bacterium]
MPANRDTEGWHLNKADIITDSGERFVRLDLKIDRGYSGLITTVSADPGDYELSIEYRSTDIQSSRDKGSWVYMAFKDAQGKNVGEQFQTFEQSPSWKSSSIQVKAPAGTMKLFISIRQQNLIGTMDIRSVEIRSAGDKKRIAVLSVEAMNALAWLLDAGNKMSPDGEASPAGGNIFLPYLKGKAPKIVRDISMENISGVVVQKFVFRSLLVGGDTQDVYAIIARPSGEGNYPGLLWLHGGYGCADPIAAIRYAKAGYITIAPDLPGIGDPKLCTNSVGPWTNRFAKLGWTTKPDPAANETFDAVVAALEAFDLLSAQPGVIKERIGISGISMGGYTTTMISGLLGKRVKAAYSKFGCGFYDRGSTWMAGLNDTPDEQRKAWLDNFDAGRRAPDIQVPYFIAAAVRDHFFWPPAVNATVSVIPGANLAYAPVRTHQLAGIPDGDNLDLLYLAYHLKGEGKPFPKVTIDGCETQADGGKLVTFSVEAPLPIQTATLFVTAGGKEWEQIPWEPIAAKTMRENRFQAVITPDKITRQGAWFVNVSDARPATAGSFVYSMEATGTGATLLPVGVTQK